MSSTNMGAIPKKEFSSEDCDQVVRNILVELEMILYRLELCSVNRELWKIEVFKCASLDLKNFFVKNVRMEEKIDQIKEKLIKRVKEIDEKEISKKEFIELKEMIMKRVKEELFKENEIVKRKVMKCFYCNRIGHRAVNCFARMKKQKYFEMNRKNNYVDQELSSDSEVVKERGYKRVDKDRRIKVGFIKEEYKNKDNRKRSKLNLERYVQEFSDVFEFGKGKIEYCPLEKCNIVTEDGKKIFKKGQTVPQALIKDTELYLRDLLRRRVIRESVSEWRNPIRSIKKPSGEVRLVSNLMALNDIVEKDNYRLANIRDVIRATQGAEYMTVFDLKEAFYSIEIREEDKHKTAFEFNSKVYEWNSMVMGYKNSPQILQRVMDRIFKDMKGKGVEIYMDDIVLYSKTIEEHDGVLREVLSKLSRNNMKLNVNKIQFCQKEVKLLGVTLNGKDIVPSEIKKNEALEFPVPLGVSDVRRFLGITGWFRDFIKNYADLTVNLTDSLKGKIKKWEWTNQMNDEFVKLKEVLRKLGKLQIANYDKDFLLRTDASNIGLGAVLLQKNNKDEWVPVQWASKKLTPTEVNYGISEKEMFAVFWGIKKFEYELRGRKFRIETDHKALREIRNKPDFKNARINRWIEKIQEFDFEIEYRVPEEMVVADSLSRIHSGETENLKKKVNENRKIKQIQGKRNKHVKVVNGKEYWVFDSGREGEIPPENLREQLILDCHISLSHRSKTTVYYELRRKYYWPGMKDQINKVLKNCITCQMYNRKTSGGKDFVSTTRYLEKVALDMIEFREENVFIVIAIDYFTRRVWGKVLKNKRSEGIIDFIKALCKEGKKPEEFVTDNGKEFCNEQFNELCRRLEIKHRTVSIEAHRSNGRIERIIRTMRDSILKNNKKRFEDKVKESIENYNLSYHVGIKCAPFEAGQDKTGIVMLENSPQGDYAKQFKKGFREKFKKNQIVRIAKNENLKGCAKYSKGRFLDMGRVIEKCPNDSYIVRLENGKLVKKRHYDLKGVCDLVYVEGD